MYRTFVVAITLTTLLGAVPAAPAAAPPSPPDPSTEAPAPRDWAGLWYTDFGFVELTADGNEITGTYSCCNGKIDGTVQGIRMEFSWKDPIYGNGWGYWYWEDRGLRVRGIFGKMEDMGVGGQWNAIRLPEPELENPVRLTVRAEHSRHGTFRGEVVLSGLEGDSLEGYLKGAYDLKARGKPFKYDMWNSLSGRRDGDALVLEWLDPLYETLGDLRVTPVENGSWVGTWQPHFLDEQAERQELRLLPRDSPPE